MAGDQVLSDNDVWGTASPAAPATTAPSTLTDDQIWNTDPVQAQGPLQPPAAGATFDMFKTGPQDGSPSLPPPNVPGEDLSDPVNKTLFKRSPAGRIWDAMKEGYEESGLGIGTMKQIQEANWFHEYDSGEKSMGQAVTDGILKPAAATADAFFRGVSGAFKGTAKGVGIADAKIFGSDENTASYQAEDFLNYLAITSGMSAEAYPIAKPSAITAEKAAVPEAVQVPIDIVGGPALAAEANTTARMSVPIEPESALMDKAGNLNMKYVNTSEDAGNMMRQVAKQYADENGTIVSHEQTIAEANEFMGKAAPVTSSKNFQDWFDGSKAVDEAGQPVRVYHGTSEDFESFKPSKDGGIYFTDNPEVASGYVPRDEGANLRPSYINIKNPYETTSEAWRLAETPTPKDLAAEGYDGVKIVGKDGTNYAVLDNAQIRSSYDQAFSDRFQASINDIANGIPDFLSKYNRGGPVNRNLSLSSRQMAVNSTEDLIKLAARAQETGSVADQQTARDALNRMRTMQGIRHEVSAEAGRTLESGKITVGQNGMEDIGKKLMESDLDDDQLIKIAATLKTPQEAAKFLNDSAKPTFGKMGLYYVMNNYLSGPITHLAYMASWGVQTLIRVGIETPVASLVGKIQDVAGKTLEPYEISDLMAEGKQLRERLAEADSTQGRPLPAAEAYQMSKRLDDIQHSLGNATTVMPKEIAARFYGLGEGALDAVKAFGRALKEGNIQMLPGETSHTARPVQSVGDVIDLMKKPDEFRDNPAQNFGSNPIVNYGRSIQNPVLRNLVGKPMEVAGQVVGIPTRVIGAIHSMQKFFGYSESLNALAYRQAASEGLEGSIRDPSTELGARIAQLKNNPPPEMMEAAVDEGKYAALMGEPGEFGKRFEALANTNGYTKITVPFARVMNNINSQQFLERTPLGLFSKTIRDNLTGANGNAVQATAWGRMATGIVLLTGAAYLRAKGVTTGQGPDDTKEAAFNFLAGKPPYSVNIGGTNWPMRFFGGPGRSLAIGSDVYDIHQEYIKEDDSNAIVGMAAHALGKDVLDETGMRGVSDLWNAITDYKRYGKYYFPNAIASMAVPMSVGQSQVGRQIDPIIRQTATPSFIESTKQAMMAKSPFFSGELSPKVDILGNPMRRDMDPSWAKHDPVMQALDDISVYPAPVSNRFGSVRLSEQQYFDYATKAGKIFYNNMLQKVTDPKWQSLDADAQADIIHKTQLKSRSDARTYMNGAYPDLTKDNAEESQGIADQAK